MSTLGDLTVPKIDQSGPPQTGEFTYIDISGIDNKLKRIIEPKRLPVSAAPSRARQRLQPGDVLVSMTRPNLNAVAIVPTDLKEAVGSTGFYVLRAVDGIEPRWLFYAVQTHAFIEAMSSLVQGALYPAVRPKDIRGFGIDALPLDEQQRIVAEIEKHSSRLDEAVVSLKRIKANLKHYKAAVLKAAVEGKLLGDSRDRVKGSGWISKPINIAIDSLDQGWSPQCENEPSDRPSVWGVIKTTAVQSMRYLESENKRLPKTLEPRPHLELAAGDLLMTRAGPRARVGVACLVKVTRPHLMLCDKVYRIRCKQGLANPAFLELVLNAPNIVDELNQLKTGISDSGVNLTQKRLSELVVPLPPLKVQGLVVTEVERRLSVIEELEATVEANLTRADRLRQAILTSAFAGKLVKPALYKTPDSSRDFPVAAESPSTYRTAR